MIFMRYMHRQRGGRVDFTREELSSTLDNQAPGSPRLSILSFKGCFHGRTIGLLSCSHSRPIQGVDIPTLPWPKADFPKYKYPLGAHAAENRAEDDRCLALVEELMEKAVRNIHLRDDCLKFFLSKSQDGQPVAGIISEPIQSEAGDNILLKLKRYLFGAENSFRNFFTYYFFHSKCLFLIPTQLFVKY